VAGEGRVVTGGLEGDDADVLVEIRLRVHPAGGAEQPGGPHRTLTQARVRRDPALPHPRAQQVDVHRSFAEEDAVHGHPVGLLLELQPRGVDARGPAIHVVSPSKV
jgi:hypothetical protein